MSVAAARFVLGSKVVSTQQVNTSKPSAIKRSTQAVCKPVGLGSCLSLSGKRRSTVRQDRCRLVTKANIDEELDTSYTGMEAVPDRPTEEFAVIDTGKWECRACQYLFDESKGDQYWPVAAGTKFKDVPDDYQCPTCGGNKKLFESKSLQVSGFAENQGYGLGGNSMTSGQKSALIYGTLFIFFALFISGYLLD